MMHFKTTEQIRKFNHLWNNINWVIVDDILAFIKQYEPTLEDLPKELAKLKEELQQNSVKRRSK